MSETTGPAGQGGFAGMPGYPNQPPPPGYGPPAPYGYGPPAPYGGGAPGEVRDTAVVVLLSIVTFGIYTWVYYYRVHDEMKRYSGWGVGGGVALLLAILVSIVMPFITASEVGELYRRRGQQPPVTGITGIWVLLPLVGTLVWLIKTNGALNSYWRSLGVA